MGTRLELHSELQEFLLDTYYQPPSNIQVVYPCIIYNKTRKSKMLANDGIYLTKQGYQITVIEKNPDSPVADAIEEHFQYCTIDQYFAMDNLNHTVLTLYY
jgi:hypothetical protein